MSFVLSLSYQALTATRPQFIQSSWKRSQLARKVHVEKQILATVAESHGMSCRPGLHKLKLSEGHVLEHALQGVRLEI